MREGVSVFYDATTALTDLVAQLQSAADTEDPNERIDATCKIQEAGAPHFGALLSQYLDNTAGSYATHEAVWKSLANYQTRLTQVLCTVATGALTARSATNALRAIRSLAKLHLIHYASIPEQLWHLTYTLHASAEQNGFAITPVPAHSSDRTMTTVEQELLRVLMLCVSAPDMLDPEQIEVVDRALERLGAEFTLRQPGIADNSFYFNPTSGNAPRCAIRDEVPTNARYFGPGVAYHSLERISKQLEAETPDKFKPFGKDLSPLGQYNTVNHLLIVWRANGPQPAPVHSPASGTILVVHDYPHVWQHISEVSYDGELSLLADSALMPQTPEVWELRGESDDELVAEVPRASRAWARCGAIIGMTVDESERWIGLIRRMHLEANDSLQADIAVLSGDATAHTLREVLEKDEDSAFTEAASREFGLSEVNAVILVDGPDGGKPSSLIVKPEHWKVGRIYELREGNNSLYLRGLKAIRRSDDFVHATFKWLSKPDS
ncbi:MAG: hypothetical protein JSW48_15565 [Betaproteobacteria bacterium]|jgi:hypothetical protein|nr:MAG: hypothetical protein JSW48_15565 [Betaproteobacteria bacterium]